MRAAEEVVELAMSLSRYTHSQGGDGGCWSWREGGSAGGLSWWFFFLWRASVKKNNQKQTKILFVTLKVEVQTQVLVQFSITSTVLVLSYDVIVL